MTAGETSSTCDASRTFIPYESTTFTGEINNGKYVCYRSIDNANNTTYKISNAINGIDTTNPIITIVNPNTDPATSKTITASKNE